jgi:hypothetical protein
VGKGLVGRFIGEMEGGESVREVTGCFLVLGLFFGQETSEGHDVGVDLLSHGLVAPASVGSHGG